MTTTNSEVRPLPEDGKAPIFETDQAGTYLKCTACGDDILAAHMDMVRQAMEEAKRLMMPQPEMTNVHRFLDYHAEGECMRMEPILDMAGRNLTGPVVVDTMPRDNDAENLTDLENVTESSAVIIPREHQSAPKEHWADKVIRVAASEIVEGKFRVKDDPTEFWNYGETMTVAQHPAVQDALERLKQEMGELRNTQEYLEKYAQYHELNEMAQRKDQWDGQGRWLGKENEEMRRGQILSPFQFMQKLCAVIGEQRVELNYFGVRGRVALLAPDPQYRETRLHSLTENPYQLEYLKGKVQVGTLQYPMGTEWMIMRFTEYGVPTTAKYLGWRTALLSMIRLAVITEEEAHKAFPLGSGQAADWYKAQLYMHRNARRLAHA